MPLIKAYAMPHPPLLVPEVGKGQEHRVQTTLDAARAVAADIAALAPETIVLISPHAPSYADYFRIAPGASARGDFGHFGAPFVKQRHELDETLAAAIGRRYAARHLRGGVDAARPEPLDHGALVPLHFVQEAGAETKLVVLSFSGLPRLDHYEAGIAVSEAVEETGRRAVLIASGDLSHRLLREGPYGFHPDGPRFDAQIRDIFASADFKALLELDETRAANAAECGLRAFWMLAGALDGKTVDARVLAYEGSYGVGYVTASFTPTGVDPKRRLFESTQDTERDRIGRKRQNESAPVRLARAAIEAFVVHKRRLEPDVESDEVFTARVACFVTLRTHGALRGCIGTVKPNAATLADEIVRNAVAAAHEDPRFPPLRKDELPVLEISVDVLNGPEPTDKKGLDPERYGVIVSTGAKQGVLLPGIEGIDTVQRQLDVVRKKAGIAAHEDVDIKRFTVTKYH